MTVKSHNWNTFPDNMSGDFHHMQIEKYIIDIPSGKRLHNYGKSPKIFVGWFTVPINYCDFTSKNGDLME